MLRVVHTALLNAQILVAGETAEQLAFLRLHKCDAAQGYYFSRPAPAEQFAELIRSGGS